MQLKLKKRELALTMYDGSKLTLGYPTHQQHEDYVNKVIEDTSKENEYTKEFFLELGMSKEQFSVLQNPDIYDIGMILTGQKKI
jgi:hypothetical protein